MEVVKEEGLVEMVVVPWRNGMERFRGNGRDMVSGLDKK